MHSWVYFGAFLSSGNVSVSDGASEVPTFHLFMDLLGRQLRAQRWEGFLCNHTSPCVKSRCCVMCVYFSSFCNSAIFLGCFCPNLFNPNGPGQAVLTLLTAPRARQEERFSRSIHVHVYLMNAPRLFLFEPQLEQTSSELFSHSLLALFSSPDPLLACTGERSAPGMGTNGTT